jgi:hypothetical protein
MKLKTKIGIAAAITTAMVGLALATPIVKLASPILASGTVSTAVNTHGVAGLWCIRGWLARVRSRMRMVAF